MAKRSTAWIAALLCANRQRVLLQLTAGALAGCPALLEWDGRLTNRIVIVQRRHHGKQSPVDAQLIEGQRPNAAVPLNTLKVLCSVWGYTEETLRKLMADTEDAPGLDKDPHISDNQQP
jgi:hypothetical protein